MKQYIATKIVDANPCTRVTHDDGGLEWGYCTKAEEGYCVIFPEGREAWLPKDAFEKVYRPMDGMSFGFAIEAAKAGKKIQRKGWNGKGQYVELATCISYKNASGEVVNVEHNAIGNAAMAFVGTSGVQMGWLASQADMLADDWQIVE